MNDCLCGVDWCYFCQEILPPNNSEHNSNWHINPGRCPLFLEEIHEFDSTWPEDQDRCMQKLHRLVCLKKLKLLDIDVLNSQFIAATAVHRRTDNVKSTLLLSKPNADPHSCFIVVPRAEVPVGSSVTVLRSNAPGEDGWTWVRTPANNYGFMANDNLSTAACRRPDPPPMLDDLFVKFPASFPPGYSIQDIREFDLHAPWYSNDQDDDDHDRSSDDDDDYHVHGSAPHYSPPSSTSSSPRRPDYP
jgi:hypothetical protein